MYQALPEKTTLGQLLRQQAAQFADKEFVVFKDRSLSYAQFDAYVDQVARGLHHMGLRQGDKLAIMLPNGIEFLGLWFACARLGLIEVPINTGYKGPLLQHLLSHSEVQAIALLPEFHERLQHPSVGFAQIRDVIFCADTDLPAPVDGIRQRTFATLLAVQTPAPEPELRHTDLLAIMYSSGTTGPSKGILLTHSYFWFSGYINQRNRKTSPKERMYTCLPLFHANAQLVTTMPALMSGATLILDDQFSASTFWQRLARSRATRFAYIGGIIPILMKQPPGDFDRLHCVKLATGGAAPKELIAPFIERFGVQLLEGYGQTENCVALANPSDAPRAGSLGKAICGYDCEVVDEQDEPLPPGQVGELVFRPQYPFIMMSGYYKNPEATAAASSNMWFHTGDLMTKDADGYFYFVDRKKDAIRRRGENISAYEVEMVVNAEPGVLESAAVAVPSELGEDELMVFVVRKPGENFSELGLIQHCEQLMPYFSVPRYIEVLPELPKTPTHRVEKYKLRAQGVSASTWDLTASGYQLKK